MPIIFNQQERAVSLDVNRLQAILQALFANGLQNIFDGGTQEDDAAGVAALGSSVTAPARGVILNGIMAQPDIGTTNLYVTPGAMFIVDVDTPPNTDASLYRLIVDPGVVTAGALTLVSNTSGQTRIDVVECARVTPQTVLEVDNRDIFNSSTGLFTATAVPKRTADQLQYRIRQGTPGAGFPGVVSGWLPLMVASVPNTATNWNIVTCWDVRPLLSDLQQAPFDVSESGWPIQASRSVVLNVPTLETITPYDHSIETSGNAGLVLGNRKVGGSLSPYSAFLDLNSATSIEATFYANLNAGISGTILSKAFFVWLVCPLGLPRWSQYTPYTQGIRKPQSPRGLPLLSVIGPDVTGHPISNLTLPAALGFGSSVTTLNASLAFAGMLSTYGGSSPLQPLPMRAAGSKMNIIGPEWNLAPVPPGSLPQYYASMFAGTSSAGDGTYYVTQFQLTDNLTHPMNATALELRFSAVMSTPSSTPSQAIQAIVSIADASGITYWRKAQTVLPSSRALVGGSPMVPATTQVSPTLQGFNVGGAGGGGGANFEVLTTSASVTFSAYSVAFSAASVGDIVHVEASFKGVFTGSNTSFLSLFITQNGGSPISDTSVFSEAPTGPDNVTIFGSTGYYQYNLSVDFIITTAGPVTIGYCVGGTGSSNTFTVLRDGGYLSARLYHNVPSVAAVPGTGSNCPIFFEIDGIPLERSPAGSPQNQVLTVVLDGRPSMPMTTAFTMDVIGWELEN